MASEQGAVGSEILGLATIPSTVPTIISNEPDVTKTKSLKRIRPDQSQNPANLSPLTNPNLGNSPKSPRYKGAFSPAGITAVALTGAAAMVDQRRLESQRLQPVGMSENPGHKALSSLMAGGGTGMSKPQDAPIAATTMSEGMSIAASAISIPTSIMKTDGKFETSPASVTSLASLGSTAATATASSTIVASPASLTTAIEAEGRDARQGDVCHQQNIVEEQSSKRPMTFPGNLLGNPDASRVLARGASLPMPGQNQHLAPRSPSQKKHKCQYCETEFTRHHNLKSHLLTHSQEKPYLCQTCNMRFRRLHDLKRHMKLHTGERPHICPKCDRKFARGDALARHSKGQGGCAGRRSSMGSFGGEDDFEGSIAGDDMDGVMYTNGTPHPIENETSEERRFSLPSIKAQHVSGPRESFAQSRAPSSYPPAIGSRPGQSSGSSGGLYPSSQSSITSTSMQPMPNPTYSQGGLMESPKPLSPAANNSRQLGHDSSSINRQRSPSLATQFQQQHFGRQQSHPSPHGNVNPPKLPSLAGLAPPEQRFTLPSSQTSTQNSTGGPPPPGQSISGATSPTNNLFAYVQTLEDKVKRLSDQVHSMQNNERSQEEKISRLSDEVFSLRSQLSASQTQQQAQSQS